MKVTFLFFLQLVCLNLFSQSGYVTNLLPKILPGSPEAASIAKYGNYPVSYFTGVADISIPLYEIRVGELSVPISIAYHASGIKVNENGSWVGLGWSLNTGGTISRKVMGLADELSGNYFSGNTVKLTSEIDAYSSDGLYYLSELSRSNKDCEPDIFSYSIPGRSGKFFFNQRDSLRAVQIPYAPIKVERSSNASYGLLFSITDERGVLHKFEDAEYTDNGGGLQTGGLSSWMLTKLMSANRQDSITFSYSQRYGQVSFDYSDKVVVTDQASGSATSNGPMQYGSSFSVFVDERKPQEILFPLGKISFEPSTADRADGYSGQKRLSKIKIFSRDPVNGDYSMIKAIVFYQSYFLSAVDSAVRDLRLDSLGICDAEEAVVEKYRFQYDTQLLPVKTSRARDYWGYYNGKSNDILVPRQSIFYQSTSLSSPTTITIGSSITNSREPDSSYMQAGVLKQIIYPTGGRTEFSYETNRYSDDGTTVILAGGLRVRSITSYDGSTKKALVKTYAYGSNESGFGRKNFLLRNYFFQMQQYMRTLGYDGTCGCSNSETGRLRSRTFASNPSIESEPFDGSPVAYQTVTEYIGDLSYPFGKTIYEFTDHADGLNTAMASNKTIITSYHNDRGQLSRKRTYKRNADGSFTVLNSTGNAYQAFPEQFFANVGLACTKTLISNNSSASDLLLGPDDGSGCSSNPPGCGSNDSYSFQYANYSIRSSDTHLTQTSDTTFDQADTTKYLVNTTRFLYDNFSHQQLTRTKSVSSTGDSLFLERKYPHEFSGISVYDDMVAKNIINKIVEESRSKNSTQIGLQKNNYKDWGSGNLAVDSIEIQNRSNSREMRAQMLAYDVKGNILSMKKSSDAPQTMLWNYKNTYVVANVANADTSDVAYTSFEADGNGNWSGINSSNIYGSSSLPTGEKYFTLTGNTLVRYGLNPGKSYIVSYWSNTGTYYAISGTVSSSKTGATIGGWTYCEHEVTGATAISLSGTGNIDEVRLYPKGALMTTYTYQPLIGITSQCDPSGKTTYYEYDTFGRLLNIKDKDRNIIKSFEYKYRQQ